MLISIKDEVETVFLADALILPVIETDCDETTGGFKLYEDIDRALDGLPSKLLSGGEFTAEHKQTLLLFTYGKIKARSVLLLGLGKQGDITRDGLRQAGGAAATYLKKMGMAEAALSMRLFPRLGLSPADFTEGVLLSQYRFGNYKPEEDKKEKEMSGLTLLTAEGQEPELKRVEAVARAVRLARDLVNTPANDMTPTVLAEAVKWIQGVSVSVIERDEARQLGMGAFLSVAKGSMEPPKFIVAAYRGAEGKPVVLIGKSITFDSGGISLKPSEGMEKMKDDMAGGAAVIGALAAVSEMKLPLHVIGMLPATENMPGGTATRPGDVVKTAGGKTIEIVNTDAEGRLVLADAIGYAKRFDPALIMDIATLTGACSIALGSEAIALMGNDKALIEEVLAASNATGERVWQMPLYKEYKEYIESDIADLKNSGGRNGSLVTAGYFLKEFAGDTRWAHLDIASTAWADKDKPYCPKGATGIGVRLLFEFLSRYAAQ